MMQNVLERDRGYDWLDSEPRTIAGQGAPPRLRLRRRLLVEAEPRDDLRGVYELMHEADPKSFPIFYP